jgi:hypothetical protein
MSNHRKSQSSASHTLKSRDRLPEDQIDHARPARPALALPAAIDQEIYALLAAYQILRIAIRCHSQTSLSGADSDHRTSSLLGAMAAPCRTTFARPPPAPAPAAEAAADPAARRRAPRPRTLRAVGVDGRRTDNESPRRSRESSNWQVTGSGPARVVNRRPRQLHPSGTTALVLGWECRLLQPRLHPCLYASCEHRSSNWHTGGVNGVD